MAMESICIFMDFRLKYDVYLLQKRTKCESHYFQNQQRSFCNSTFFIAFLDFSFVYDFCAKIFYSIFGITNANLFVTLLIFVLSLALLYYIGVLVEKNKEVLLIKFTEMIIAKIPFVKSVYSGIKEVLSIFLGKNKDGYLGVAYINVGNMELIGFITKEEEGENGGIFWVFVPTTPILLLDSFSNFPKAKSNFQIYQ